MTLPRRARVLLEDVRAVGPTAPLRAAYESSKRFGGHALVFNAIRTPEIVFRHPVFTAPSGIGSVARARTLADAEGLHGGYAPVFGKPVPLAAGWHTAPDSGGSWSREKWWQVDIRSDDRLADVKWTWELGRQRHLLVLARACFLAPEDPRHRALLTPQLTDWIQANPPETGVHWYSNLEIALRAIVWLQILDLVGDLPTALVNDLHRHLLHSGKHLIADLPYTVSSMRNNHLLGDGLGLIALGQAFERPRWKAIGNRLFNGQLARHMRPDGSMIEDSLSYHRFVTEMLAVRALLDSPPPAVTTALRTSGEYLARLGVFDGSVPQFGDWDEGRVLGSSADPLNVAGCSALALALTGAGAPAPWREAYDECAWHVREGAPSEAPAAEAAGHAVGGGLSRVRRGPWTVFLKAGGGRSHQHADLCSTTIRWKDQWIVGDPGTGTYNGPLEQRNAFRTSTAHSVLRLAGNDQLVPHRAFRWVQKAQGVVGPPLALPVATVSWGLHDAYVRETGLGRVARIVVVTGGQVVVTDVAEAVDGTTWDLCLPLHSAVSVAGDVLTLPDGEVLQWTGTGECSRVRGSTSPYAGWWSDTYGSAEPTTWLTLRGELPGAVSWAISRPGRSSYQPLVDGVEVDGSQLRIAFSAEGAALTVTGDVPAQTVFARLPS